MTRSRSRGFSLVELMIAITLGLLVSIALVSMFVGVRSASRMTSGVGALSDSGRFALDRIEQAVRAAGNLACNSTAPVAVAGTPVARQLTLLNGGASPLITDYGEPLAGYEAQVAGADTAPGTAITTTATPVPASAAGDWVTTPTLGPSLDAVLFSPKAPLNMAAPVGSPIDGSDILVVHETLPGTLPAYLLTNAGGATSFTVNSSSILSAGQIGVVSNCVQMETFQVANFNPGEGSGIVSLTGGAASPGNSAGTLPTDPDFTIGAEVAPADSIAYYIGVGEDGDAALFKYETNGGVYTDSYAVNEELVPDVENMQVLYGVETALSSTTQTVAQWVTADKVATYSLTGDFNGVIAVKVALLVASPPTAVQPPAAAMASSAVCSPPAAGSLPCLEGVSWTMAAPDSRVRKVYEQTMFLRDMSP